MPNSEAKTARDFVRKLLRRTKGSSADETNRALVGTLYLISEHLAGIENVLCEIESAEARRSLADTEAIGACTMCGKLHRMSDADVSAFKGGPGERGPKLSRCDGSNCDGFVAPL